MLHSREIKTTALAEDVSDLNCPRCGATQLHHADVTIYDRGEDVAHVTKTTLKSNGVLTVEPRAPNAGNPSNRRDGLTIKFSCENCGDAPIELTIAQHKGSTEIGWRYEEASE